MSSVNRQDDRTAAARIRDEAIARFGDVGFQKATVRDIASAAGVSAGLVLHHFGSKEGLREACDAHVAAQYGERRNRAVDSGNTDAFAALSGLREELPHLKYLLRSLREGTPASARLFDEIVRETEALMAHSVEAGVLRPSDNLHDLVVLLVGWQFGGLVLQEHIARAMGAEPFSDELVVRIARASLEVLTHGVFADSGYEDAWKDFEASGEPPPSAERL
jgi:AcrR family transcriptional regulator